MSQSASERTNPQQRVDPVTASIIQGALENIAIEMGYKLMRMSYSSIIRESEDFGAAICDASERPPAMVVEDVLDGYFTRESAARDFQVAIDADGKLDQAATQRR